MGARAIANYCPYQNNISTKDRLKSRFERRRRRSKVTRSIRCVGNETYVANEDRFGDENEMQRHETVKYHQVSSLPSDDSAQSGHGACQHHFSRFVGAARELFARRVARVSDAAVLLYLLGGLQTAGYQGASVRDRVLRPRLRYSG